MSDPSSSDTLSRTFAAALRTSYGDASVSYAVRRCAVIIRSARRDGARWQDIAAVLSATLTELQRPPIAAASLRALFCRASKTDLGFLVASRPEMPVQPPPKTRPSADFIQNRAGLTAPDHSSARILQSRARLREIDHDRKN